LERLSIPWKGWLPFIGYSSYLSLSVDFFRTFGTAVEVKRGYVIENTALYFFLGAYVVIVMQLLPPMSPWLGIIVLAGCAIATVFEVDIMFKFPDARLLGKEIGWKKWKAVPRGIAKTSGRKLIALGMYHATIFLVAGMTVAYVVFP